MIDSSPDIGKLGVHNQNFIVEERCIKSDFTKSQNAFFSSAEKKNKLSTNSEFQNILSSFIKREDGAYNFKRISTSIADGVEIHTYTLSSQFWPIENQNDPAFLWNHRLIIYKPDNVLHNTAFMYVNGGNNIDEKGNETFQDSPEQLDFIGLAKRNNIIVVNLLNVPNQYIFFGDQASPLPKREDQILAYTYRKVMEDPAQNAYLAGHLPMAKSIVKGMDAVEDIVSLEFRIEIKNFILSGASKRGWAAWLAALEDERVSALMPVVIDILNVRKNIHHICSVYGGTCPIALKDYINEGVIEALQSKNGEYLMDIEDPLSYLKPEYDTKYLNRLGIAKYIINASGDDFFTPDSSRFYFNILPGKENYIRYIPNAAHYLLGGKIGTLLKTDVVVQDAVERYLSLQLNKVALPQVSWEFFPSQIVLHSSAAPQNVKLWRAYNEESRDFRCLQINHSPYQKLSLWYFFAKKYIASWFTEKLCDAQYSSINIDYQCDGISQCVITAELPKITRGFQAAFLEIDYFLDDMNPFTITTEVNIAGVTDTPYKVTID
ncbi:PhoPQ-activated protein PqaA family protein [Candidatus Lariskella endosymbiont of Epinotia ramella]|uniref:PhoPQ-activated protein PqaA family protein n=1 Tax=Candidatus Lariskella endosymbiont of Epinotia ramella TaxID=3066224 RepID=UPI0030D536FF